MTLNRTVKIGDEELLVTFRMLKGFAESGTDMDGVWDLAFSRDPLEVLVFAAAAVNTARRARGKNPITNDDLEDFLDTLPPTEFRVACVRAMWLGVNGQETPDAGELPQAGGGSEPEQGKAEDSASS